MAHSRTFTAKHTSRLRPANGVRRFLTRAIRPHCTPHTVKTRYFPHLSPSPLTVPKPLRSGAATAKLDSPPPTSATLHVQRKRSNTDNVRERSASVRLSQARGDEEDSTHGGRTSPVEMLLGKGYTWKTAKTRLPPSRQLLHSLRNPRFLLGFGLFTLFIVLWRSLSPMAGEVQRYVM